jgi:hypothetical protein
MSLSVSAWASRTVRFSKIFKIFSRAFEEAPSRPSLMACMSSARDGLDVEDMLELIKGPPLDDERGSLGQDAGSNAKKNRNIDC